METPVLRKWRKRTLKNFMDILIMKILREEGAKSGYDFISLFHEKFGVFISSGTVYSRLYSMERDDLIKGVWDRTRRVFELTEKGKRTIDLILRFGEIDSQSIAKLTRFIFSDASSSTEKPLQPKLKTKQKFKAITWALVSRDHHEILKKIQLIEAALISLLKDFSSDTFEKELREKPLEIVKDFLKLYRLGIVQHFKVEEVALFPVLHSVTTSTLTGDRVVEQLLSEHKTINSKYFKLKNITKSSKDPLKTLAELLKALSTHAEKEERLLPQLIRALDEKQLRMIDEKVANMGYHV